MRSVTLRMFGTEGNSLLTEKHNARLLKTRSGSACEKKALRPFRLIGKQITLTTSAPD